MLFVLNIGNTNCQYGLYCDGSFQTIESCPTTELCASIIPQDTPIACASVVPEALDKLELINPFIVSANTDLGISFPDVDSSTIGADRLANAVALTQGELPAICIDCGTALTFEAVNAKREFIGGAIAPGRALMRQALHDHTAQLPIVPFKTDIPPIGTTTTEAIITGIDRGIIGSVKEIINSISNGESFRAVAVGGDAQFICNHIPECENGGEDFTLQGIVTAWEHNQQCG